MHRPRFIPLVVTALMLLFATLAIAQDTKEGKAAGPTVGAPAAARAVKVPNAQLKVDPSKLPAATVPEGEPLHPLSPGRPAPIPDPVIQLNQQDSGKRGAEAPGEAGIGLISDPLINIPAINSGSQPPDTNMDVGPNHIVQMTNGTTFQVWNKQGVDLSGPLNFGNLWPAGDACNSNLGDPVVVYDHLADRWLLTQFARNAAKTQFWMCLAVSQTPTPLPGNGFFLYTIEVPVFPDYPKFGVWPDAYYMTDYEGGNLGVFAFDRQNMLNGQAAGFIRFTIPSLSGSVRETRILPADLDGPPPPDGTPNYFFRSVDDRQDTLNPVDRLEIYEFHVDWLNPANSTFTLATTITGASTPSLAPFNTFACDRSSTGDPNKDFRDCIPQPGDVDTIDALSNRPMMQLKFRVMGPSDYRMVVNQTIDVSGSINAVLGFTPAKEVAGLRWYELQRTSDWAIRQQGTYAPQPNGATGEDQLLHRWMASAAMDGHGSIALGYSIVNSDGTAGQEVFPGMRYTGRRFDDPLGSMPQGEKVIFDGTRAQGNGDMTVDPQRWGDYSALVVDPADDCTFWYTTHMANGEPPSRTRIASFRFDYCGTDLAVSKTAAPDPVVAGSDLTYTITASNHGPLDATNVVVTDTLPAGVSYTADTDSCSPSGNVLTCSLGSIANGGSTSFEIQVHVDPNLIAGGTNTITNTAVVSADQAELNPDDNTASVTTLVEESADLRLAKTCKPDGPAPAGTNATCLIEVDNVGPSTARSVVITDQLVSSGAFTLVAATPSVGSCGPLSGDTITCSLGDLAAATGASIRVVVTASDAVDVNDLATATAATPDPNLSNNTATGVIHFVASADLALTKTAAPDPVVAGTALTYTITVSNNGPSAASGVVVQDTLPAQVAVLSVTPSVGSCTGGIPGNPAQPLICNLGVLASGGPAATITVVARVDPSTSGGTVLINNASVASDVADPNNGNNLSTATASVAGRADLGIAQASDKPNYKPNTTITFIVTATNNGPSDAQAVVVTDTMPLSQQILYMGNTGGCTQAGKILTCDLGTMPAGSSRSFNVYILVKGNRGLITNSVEVTSSTVDPGPTPNTNSYSVSVK